LSIEEVRTITRVSATFATTHSVTSTAHFYDVAQVIEEYVEDPESNPSQTLWAEYGVLAGDNTTSRLSSLKDCVVLSDVESASAAYLLGTLLKLGSEMKFAEAFGPTRDVWQVQVTPTTNPGVQVSSDSDHSNLNGDTLPPPDPSGSGDSSTDEPALGAPSSGTAVDESTLGSPRNTKRRSLTLQKSPSVNRCSFSPSQ
jgi:hypothetical protein